MTPSNVQTRPILLLDIRAGIWPRFNTPPLRLAATPPRNPLLTETWDVEDGRHAGALMTPGDNFLGTMLQRQLACTLDTFGEPANEGRKEGTYPRTILTLKLQVTPHHFHPMWSTIHRIQVLNN